MASTLNYHAAAFANLGISPEIDPRACELLARREIEIALTFPASVRELWEHRHAEQLLQGVQDEVVPLTSFALDYTFDRPIARLFDDREGMYSAFVHFDGKSDPDVRLLSDLNEWREDENGLPMEVIGPFSFVVWQQTECVREHEANMVEFARERQEKWENRSLWERFVYSMKRWGIFK